MWMKSRNGIRKLNRALRRPLGRRCIRYAGKISPGARRRHPNYLAMACSAINQALRIHRRLAKQDPHIFGPRSHDYFLDTLAEERRLREAEEALCKVYGPPAPGELTLLSTFWTDRYEPKPDERKIFLKWFHENYPS
jgi:hypothetical protein